MNTYPQDILEAAKKAAKDAFGDLIDPEVDDVEIFAKVILDERNRARSAVPLKWETYAGDKAVGEPREHYGFHVFGYYLVTKDVTPDRQYWHLSTFTNRGQQRHIASFPKLSDAKETAQTDFAAQVALTIDT